MRPDDKPALVALVADALAYYRQPASEFTLSVWWQACQPFELEQVSKAMTVHATHPERGQFAPKVADIVRILQGTHTDRANLAWGKALDAMARVGAYTDVVFDDPAIHAVIEDVGGWPKACRTEMKDLSYLQHRFCQAYTAYIGRGAFDHPRRLMGDRSPDHEYERKGLPVPKPAIVGDPKLCALVYQGGKSNGKTPITFASLGALTALALPHRRPGNDDMIEVTPDRAEGTS
ncbi:DUF6475 domain-containing protein [Variovorax dokdonensis]|uniref:DUF6475 domain-containing protein n=1 Tax=Variovorax dokdonensis TaxID=344883 RepID=A0ABT7N794_9BURK|nr:DUF6475 domain-containing protein [Variovorax dokdonensis]MDM0043750.1 DUF6475 domain-containing protein [Variovorax dokdonensis]